MSKRTTKPPAEPQIVISRENAKRYRPQAIENFRSLTKEINAALDAYWKLSHGKTD